MGFTSLTHACSTASRLAVGCAPSPVSADRNHLLMLSHFTHPCLQHSFRACWGLRPQPHYRWWQSLTHASAWGLLHSPMPVTLLQALLGAAPPAPLSLMTITHSCLQHGVHFTHSCLQHSFRVCWRWIPVELISIMTFVQSVNNIFIIHNFLINAILHSHGPWVIFTSSYILPLNFQPLPASQYYIFTPTFPILYVNLLSFAHI